MARDHGYRKREVLAPYWAYAEWGELPISDPNVYHPLYFFKGALALHALRETLGDRIFFSGFKKIFEHQTSDKELKLSDIQKIFEIESGACLSAFFEKWYRSNGLPEVTPDS